MAVYLGSNSLKNAYLGSTPLTKIYLGATLVWEKEKKFDVGTLETGSHYHDGYAIRYDYYTLIGGGRNAASTSDKITIVRAFNNSLTMVSAPDLSFEYSGRTVTQNGEYAFFAGGQASSTQTTTQIDVYDSSLVKTTLTAGSGNALSHAVASAYGGSIGLGASRYAVIAGGYVRSSSTVTTPSPLYMWNQSLTKTVSSSSTGKFANYGGTSANFGANGSYLACLPGQVANGTAGIALQRISATGTITTTSNFGYTTSNQSCIDGAASSLIGSGYVAVFAGGRDNSHNIYSTVKGLTAQATAVTLPSMSVSRYDMVGAMLFANNKYYATFAGGNETSLNGTNSKLIEGYDESYTLTKLAEFPTGCTQFCGGPTPDNKTIIYRGTLGTASSPVGYVGLSFS